MEITPHPGRFPKPLEASSNKFPFAHHHAGILAPVVLRPAKPRRSRLPGDGLSIAPAVPALTGVLMPAPFVHARDVPGFSAVFPPTPSV